MRVSRAQAEENRRAVIEAAGRLFRERGFNGVGLNDLMGAVGLTQGGFYKQFKSKDDLAVQACERVLTDSAEKLAQLLETGDDPLPVIVDRYLSRNHRDRTSDGCIFASLGPDAARHSPDMIRSFENGIRSYLDVIGRATQASTGHAPHNDPATILSTMVGALVLSRLVEDETLSAHILDAAAKNLLGRSDSPGPDAS